MALLLGAPAPCPGEQKAPSLCQWGGLWRLETVVPACHCACTKVRVCHSPQGALSLSRGQQAEVAGASQCRLAWRSLLPWPSSGHRPTLKPETRASRNSLPVLRFQELSFKHVLMGGTNIYLDEKHPSLFPNPFYKGFGNQRGGQVYGEPAYSGVGRTVNVAGNRDVKSSSAWWLRVDCQVCVDL